jgi:hypothetical protein
VNDESQETRLLREAIKKQRGYADFFGWPERSVMERGIVDELFSALHRDLSMSFSKLRSREPGQDPPDCEAVDSAGALVGIEVTELVDAGAIHEARKRNPSHWADWSRASLVAAIHERILTKGQASPKGGPYQRYLLVIHTDEPVLSHGFVKQSLAGHSFTNAGILTEAWLLLSYDPGSQSYPYLRLPLTLPAA